MYSALEGPGFIPTISEQGPLMRQLTTGLTELYVVLGPG